MIAFANHHLLTWTLIGCIALLGVWMAVRAWSRRRVAHTATVRTRLADGTLSPRAHHYYFAHAAMKELAFEDPERLVIAMAAPEAETFLNEMWDAVGKDVAAMAVQQQQGGESDPQILPSDGLEAIPARVAGRPAALVRLPEPRATTEAYFIAVVLNHELAEPVKPAPEAEVFYFTLEKGFSLDGSPRTVFCEWDESTHKNYGDGPPPDARGFLDHVAAHLSATATPAPQATFEKDRKQT
jgi:hypothetical protein